MGIKALDEKDLNFDMIVRIGISISRHIIIGV
jgi:hypothetical protein